MSKSMGRDDSIDEIMTLESSRRLNGCWTSMR